MTITLKEARERFERLKHGKHDQSSHGKRKRGGGPSVDGKGVDWPKDKSFEGGAFFFDRESGKYKRPESVEDYDFEFERGNTRALAREDVGLPTLRGARKPPKPDARGATPGKTRTRSDINGNRVDWPDTGKFEKGTFMWSEGKWTRPLSMGELDRALLHGHTRFFESADLRD